MCYFRDVQDVVLILMYMHMETAYTLRLITHLEHKLKKDLPRLFTPKNMYKMTRVF